MRGLRRVGCTVALWWVTAGAALSHTSLTSVAVSIIGGFLMAEFLAVALEVLDEVLPANNQEAQ